jgi:hypothetical protein
VKHSKFLSLKYLNSNLKKSNDFGMLLNCVNSYPLKFETRDQIARLIAQQISSIKYVLFGLLLFDNKLVALIRPKTKNIHPVDIHLLVNVVTGLDTPKSAEFTWYPICLPNFNSTGISLLEHIWQVLWFFKKLSQYLFLGIIYLIYIYIYI